MIQPCRTFRLHNYAIRPVALLWGSVLERNSLKAGYQNNPLGAEKIAARREDSCCLLSLSEEENG